MILRNRFLNTTAVMLAPPEKPLTEAVTDVQDTGDDGGDQDAGDDTGEQQAAGDVQDDGAVVDENADDDPDLADLPPEVRAKAKAAIDKRVAKETGWRDRQLNKLHARNRAAQEDVKALETIADPARRAEPAKPGATFTEEEVERRANLKAAQTDYDNKANVTDAEGKATYGDKWGTTLAKLPKLGGVEVSDMVDILATDQPHVVLFQLSDPDTYDRVMALPPARRRNEFVKLSLKPAPKVTRKSETAESKRPADDAVPPVTPVNGGRRVAATQVNLYDDKAADDAWYAARNASRRKKFSEHA